TRPRPRSAPGGWDRKARCASCCVPIEFKTNGQAAGLPTIQDQDLLIYYRSKAMSEVNAGRPAPEKIRMSTAELLRFANRTLGGHQYAAIEASIYRLTTLTLKTNIRGEDAVYTELFGVVDHASMVRGTAPRRRSGALLGCSIIPSKWIRAAIEARKILTLHDDYFRVRRPLDRAVHQLICKHCGEQRDWTVQLSPHPQKIRRPVGGGRLPGFQRPDRR
ncbi:MAG: replication initiator protein A, partial [Albidovulum sp.]|nr:replication initiator protein A [Albidovulum sp.]